jgi:LacI family transcriptional regulator
MSKIRISDIASAANVSPATVDRVLNRRGGVSTDKERRVLEQARKLGIDRDLQRNPGKILRFGVLMQHPANPFYQALQKSFLHARSLYRHANIQISLHHFDASHGLSTSTMQGVASKAEQIADQHDAMLVVLPDEPELTQTLDNIGKRIPLVVVASDLSVRNKLAYIGIDNRAAGRTAAELMGRFIGRDGGKILLISGMQSYISQSQRQAGFHTLLTQRFPQCELLALVETREQPQQAGRLLAAALQQEPQLAGVYNLSTGDQSIAAVLQRHFNSTGHKPVFISHELTPERRNLLKAGMIDAVIDQNPEKEALSAITLLARYFSREGEKPLGIQPEITVYLRENCDPRANH